MLGYTCIGRLPWLCGKTDQLVTDTNSFLRDCKKKVPAFQRKFRGKASSSHSRPLALSLTGMKRIPWQKLSSRVQHDVPG
mmetsp:Transcript_39466/g.65445  ORF Transcript_39466/g.65445 Transcript_39466/m.65445 type:complete len:80 (-) Transcript_39466:167-406(-)